MANLPENTSYNNSGSSMPTGINFSNLLKSLQQKTQSASSDVVNSATPVATPPAVKLPSFIPPAPQPAPITPYPIPQNNNALMYRSTPDEFTQLFGAPIAPALPTSTQPGTAENGIPLDTPIGTQTPGADKTEPLPGGYYQFTPTDKKANWVAPSDQTKLRDWPTALGGGQYTIDPAQPGKMVKSDRTIMDDIQNPGAKQKVLGNLSPSLYQVDHIVPLWVGGSDTLANLQVLDLVTHEKKTAIQAVPLTLLAAHKITLEEARQMALTWNEKDPSGLPSDAEITKLGGFVPLNVAEKYKQKWQDDIGKVDTMKYFGDAFKENMANFGKGWLPAPISEFAKGLVGGGTAGIVPGTAPSPDSGAVGTVSNIAGNVLGSVTGLGILGKGIGAIRGIMGGAKVAEGIGNGITIANDAMKASSLAPDIGSLTPATLSASSRASTLSKMASSAGLLSLWGQIGTTGKEITGQETPTFNNHVSQFLTDVAYGSLLGSAGQTVRGYATVGLGSTAFSLMSGSSIVPALQDGALMTALHGLGYEKGLIDPKITTGNEEAYKMAATTLNQYLGEVVPTVKKGESIPQVLNIDVPSVEKMRTDYQSKYPNDQRFTNTPPITTQADAVSFLGNAAKRNFGNIIAKSDGTIPQEDLKKEMTRITVAQNQLLNQTLSPDVRAQKEMQDLYSLGEKLRPQIKSDQLRGTTNTTNLLNSAPFRTSNELLPNPDGLTFPTGNVPSTGYGDKIDTVSKQTINDFFNNPNKYSDKIYVVKDPETSSIMRLVQQEQIASGQKSNVGNPEDALRIFVKSADGQLHPAGYIPREESFTKNNGLNKTYHEITNRLRSLIARAPSAEELQKALAKDRAQVNISTDEVSKLFATRDTVPSMDDETLYSLLKPSDAFEKYNSALNNSNLSEAMSQKGINVLVVDKNKLMPSGAALPRANADNPYLSLNVNEQDWLRSLEYKKGNIKPASEVEQGISGIVSKQKSENMAKTAGNILDKVNQTTPSTPTETPAEVKSPEPVITKFTPAEVKALRKQGYSEQLIKVLESRNVSTTPFLESRMPPHVSEVPNAIEEAKVAPTSPVEPQTATPIEEPLAQKFENVVEAAKPDAGPRPRTFIQMKDVSDGVNSGMAAYTSDPQILKNYTREKLTEKAKALSNNGTDVPGGWVKYLADWENDIKKATDNPDFKITNKRELGDLQWSYKHLVDSGRRLEISQNPGQAPKIGEGPLGSTGQVDKDIQDYNQAHGLPKDAMNILTVNKDKTYSKEFMSDSREKFDENKFALSNIKGEKYMSMGITAKGAGNVVYVKYEPTLAKTFDANREKYENPGESLKTPEEKFARVFAVDVLNLPKDTSAADFVKRANLLYNRYDRYSEPDLNDKVKIHILTADKISKYPELKLDKSQLENPDSAAAKNTLETYSNGSTIDGKIIIGEKLYDKLVKAFNFDPKKFGTGLKPLINGDIDVNGQLTKLIQKGHAIKADPAIRDMLKSDHNLDLGANDIASFDTNSKVGPKAGTYDLPLSSIYAKDLSVGNEGRIKISKERQFNSSDEGVKDDMVNQTNERRKDYEAITEEISNAKNKTDLENVINKYADRYNLNRDDLFFGGKGESFDLGAAKINLSHDLGKILKNIYSQTVISDSLPNSSRVFISPSLKLPFDGPNKPSRFLNNDEILLGKEFMAKRNLKSGDQVLVTRDPSYDINNMVVAKVIDGSKFGHTSLGNEHGAVSLYNERLKLGGDQDADTMLVTKVGKGGVEQSYADAVLKRGSKAIPFTEVNPNAKSYITPSNIEKVIKDQLVGDDQTSKISTINRIMDSTVENKLSFKIYPAERDETGKNTSRYEILSNGIVVEKGNTTPSAKGFTASPKWGPDEKQLRTQALQEAVDSKKSNDIVRRTENNNPNWMLKQVFADEKGGKLDDYKARSLNGALKNYQNGFNPEKIAEKAKSVDEIQKQLAPFNEMSNKIKNIGGNLTPWQEKLLSLVDVKTFKVPQEEIVAADKRGVDYVRQNVKDVDLNNPALEQLKKFATTVKETNLNKKVPSADKKEAIKRLNDYYTSKVDKGEYSQKDIDAIAYWAATAKEANLKHGEGFKNPKFIYRLNTMINKSPAVAKAYYEGSETVPETTKETKDGAGGPYDGKGGLLSNAWGNLKTNLTTPISNAISNISNIIKTPPPTPVPPTPTPVSTPTIPPLDTTRFLKAIASNETSVVKGDPSKSSQFSGLSSLGSAMGTYRVTAGELASYSPRYLGKSVTPQEFQKSKALQDTYMTNKAVYLNKQGYTPQQIADIHNKGIKNSSSPGSTVYQNPSYVNKFNAIYNSPTSQQLSANI